MTHPENLRHRYQKYFLTDVVIVYFATSECDNTL